VPDRRSHRGAHPEDAKLFGDAALPILRDAAEHLQWLLDRGYPLAATLKLVGDRHHLRQRQRVALGRCACTSDESARRGHQRLDADQIAGTSLSLDGYNVLTTVEAALGGGVILKGRDDCLRDMASMHGTYRRVAETTPALEVIGEVLSMLRVGPCRWYLDRPVSNSGRLAAMIRGLAADRGWSCEVELVHDPDALLARANEPIATADSGILDRCARWLNLARIVVDQHVPDAWVVDLSGRTPPLTGATPLERDRDET